MSQFCDSSLLTPRGPPCEFTPAKMLKWSINSQSPDILSHMRICDEDGAQEVPDPICPTNIIFFSLGPTRTPMSLPDITSSEPMFAVPIPGIPSVPFIPPIAPGEGLAV